MFGHQTLGSITQVRGWDSANAVSSGGPPAHAGLGGKLWSAAFPGVRLRSPQAIFESPGRAGSRAEPSLNPWSKGESRWG